jgi:cbb3-type cytochrome oxidase subunit 3
MDWFITHAPTIALVGFFLAFLWIALSLVRPGAKQRAQQNAKIPLKEEHHG